MSTATRLSEHFTLEEMTASDTARRRGIANKPEPRHVVAMTYLANYILEPLRRQMGEPVKIGSGYRCPALNAAVGGVANSQHTTGQAADLCIDGDTAKGRRWFQYIRDHMHFDQLIWEHNPRTGSHWVHVSYVHPGFGVNRMRVIDGLVKR